MRKRAFWFHYNKPASRSQGKPQITIHYKGVCHIVDNLVYDGKIEGRIRKTQPHWVISGKTSGIEIKNNIAYIQ